MQAVYVHVNGTGAWALTKCPGCREVHKYPLCDATADAVFCKSCKRSMDIRGALAVEDTSRVAALPVGEHQIISAALH
jgi:hypothetical protein